MCVVSVPCVCARPLSSVELCDIPHVYVRQGEGKLSDDGVRGIRAEKEGLATEGEDADAPPMELLARSGPATSSEEYYPTVAINALMRVLRDPALSSHHLMVVRSLMFVFKALGLQCVTYLPKVMPVLFVVVRTGEDALREFLFEQFTQLVAILRQHVRKYLEELLTLVYEHWHRVELLPHLLALLEQLSRALHDEFRLVLTPSNPTPYPHASPAADPDAEPYRCPCPCP